MERLQANHTGVLFALVLAVFILGCPRSDTAKQPFLAFAAGGEVTPAAAGNMIFETEGARVFEDILPLTSERDLVLVDFSGPLDLGCQPLPRDEVRRWDPKWLDFLAAANLRILDLANDHALDCGREALRKTSDDLLGRGFYPVGAGRNQKEASAPVYLTRNGVTVSFISFLLDPPPGVDPCPECTGPAIYDKQTLFNALGEMKRRAQYRVVVLHFKERPLPELTPEELTMAREALDFGADLVIGQGPLSAGGLYYTRGKWIIASLGTLTGMAAPTGGKAAGGLLLSAEFSPSRLMNLRLAPLRLENGAPQIIRGEEAAPIIERLTSKASIEVQANAKLIGDILFLK